VPGAGFYARRGNLNASEEIVWREKKSATFPSKMVHIEAFTANSAPCLVLLRNFSDFASLRLDEIRSLE